MWLLKHVVDMRKPSCIEFILCSWTHNVIFMLVLYMCVWIAVWTHCLAYLYNRWSIHDNFQYFSFHLTCKIDNIFSLQGMCCKNDLTALWWSDSITSAVITIIFLCGPPRFWCYSPVIFRQDLFGLKNILVFEGCGSQTLLRIRVTWKAY